MDFKEWSSLSTEEQQRRCQSLNPYEEWPLFKAVEAEFMRQHGNQPGISGIFCGLGSSMGPVNSLTVSIRRGGKRTHLPKHFMGFPVMRSYNRSAQQDAPGDGFAAPEL